MVRAFDPLKCIPSVDAVRRRLAAIQEEARRLKTILRTAEEIRQENERATPDPEVDDQENGGDD